MNGVCIRAGAFSFGVSRVKEWAKWLYQSQQWKSLRKHIYERDNGLCVRCHKPGDIVHHKIWLTPKNINDPAIAFGVDNLELLCRGCHALEHEGELPTDSGLVFDEQGNLIRRGQHDE